jgi:diaminopimelate epimerase
MYLRRRGWTELEHFSLQTGAGDIRATIDSDHSCAIELGAAHLRSDDYPAGSEDGAGELTAGGRTWRFRHVAVGNPQCVMALASEAQLAALDLPAIGPPIERHRLFPNRTNVSWYTALAPDRIRARIFERGVGETASSGTGATGAAVAHVLDGGRSPVAVVLDGGELEVEVGPKLELTLRGWALPVFSGALAPEFEEELRARE